MNRNLYQERLQMSLLLEEQTSFEKYDRGFTLYQEQKVYDIEQKEAIFSGKVEDSQQYESSIDLGRYDGECSCSRDFPEERCEHLVALALTISDRDFDKKQAKALKDRAKNRAIEQAKKTIKMSTKVSREKSTIKKGVSPSFNKELQSFFETATDKAQIQLLHQLLQSDNVLQQRALLLLKGEKNFDLQSLTKLFRKHVQNVEKDPRGKKAEKSLKEIILNLNRLWDSFEENESSYEKSLKVAGLMQDELLVRDGFNVLYAQFYQFVDRVIFAYDRSPTQYRKILESGLEEKNAFPFWERIIENNSINTQMFVYEQIEKNNLVAHNSHNSVLSLSREEYQKKTLQSVIQHLTISDEEYFHKIIEKCNEIMDKAQYCRLFYKKLHQYDKYLQYVDIHKDPKITQYAINSFIELKRWDELKQVVDRAKNNLDILESYSGLRFLPIHYYALTAQVIRETEKDPRESLQELYKEVKNSSLSEEHKAEFFWDEKQYQEIVDFFKWARYQALMTNMFSFTNYKKDLLFYAQQFAHLIHPEMENIFRQLLEIEKMYLSSNRGSSYDFTYDIARYAYNRGLKAELKDFIQYCATHYPTRKKLNEVLKQMTLELDF